LSKLSTQALTMFLGRFLVLLTCWLSVPEVRLGLRGSVLSLSKDGNCSISGIGYKLRGETEFMKCNCSTVRVFELRQEPTPFVHKSPLGGILGGYGSGLIVTKQGVFLWTALYLIL
jgi:hypothetical protein